VESNKSFASHHNLLYILLSDANNKVRKLYGISPELEIPGRVTYVIDKKASLNTFSFRNSVSLRHTKEALLASRA
jgi:thioredoxin-dependent peroxiredoxin